MDEFGQRLSVLLEKNQMSAYRLAKKLDVHQTTIKNWREGKCEPKAGDIVNIATLFNVTCDYLLGR
jgi:repressor LexA